MTLLDCLIAMGGRQFGIVYGEPNFLVDTAPAAKILDAFEVYRRWVFEYPGTIEEYSVVQERIYVFNSTTARIILGLAPSLYDWERANHLPVDPRVNMRNGRELFWVLNCEEFSCVTLDDEQHELWNRIWPKSLSSAYGIVE